MTDEGKEKCSVCNGIGVMSDKTLCPKCYDKKEIYFDEQIVGKVKEATEELDELVTLYNKMVTDEDEFDSNIRELERKFQTDNLLMWPDPILKYCVDLVFKDEIEFPCKYESIRFLSGDTNYEKTWYGWSWPETTYTDTWDWMMYEITHPDWYFKCRGQSTPDWFSDKEWEIIEEKDPEKRKELLNEISSDTRLKYLYELELHYDSPEEFPKPEKSKHIEDRYSKWFERVGL